MKFNFEQSLFNPTRLLLVSKLLTKRDSFISFSDLRYYLNTTAGNLASHIRSLKKHDFIDEKKEIIDRHPKTSYRITSTCIDDLERLKAWLKSLDLELNK